MQTHLILTLKDIFFLTIIAIVVGGITLYVCYHAFVDWKNSPNRWWNRNKRK